MEARQVLIRPLVTEKSTRLMEDGTYVFVVDRRATKIDIRRAVEQVFGVKVVAVNTLNVRGKWRRMGRFRGKRPDWKKAVVRLAPGQRIPLFEGV